MNFTAHIPNTGRRLGGLGVMLGVHALVAYALVAGLHPITAPIAQAPMNVQLIEVALPTPPSPTPQRSAPRPIHLPSPTLSPAPIQAQDISTQEITPDAAADPTPEAPALEMPTPATRDPTAAVLCPGHQDAIRASAPPREVLAEGVGGEVLVEFTVTPSGVVRNPIPISFTNPRLNRWALHTVLTQIRCQPQAHAVQLRVPISVRFE